MTPYLLAIAWVTLCAFFARAEYRTWKAARLVDRVVGKQ